MAHKRSSAEAYLSPPPSDRKKRPSVQFIDLTLETKRQLYQGQLTTIELLHRCYGFHNSPSMICGRKQCWWAPQSNTSCMMSSSCFALPSTSRVRSIAKEAYFNPLIRFFSTISLLFHHFEMPKVQGASPPSVPQYRRQVSPRRE
jgi:hypothetical protein